MAYTLGRFDESEDTWEPIEDLVVCEQLLSAFRRERERNRDETAAEAVEKAKKRNADRAAEVDRTGA
ncbi:hypothetical protein CYMTET_46240 [Cymbomonas tetramitiformis]|uniref:Chromo domain-containing protein n=1 Tax=Cymbomonas tetramitiformis TaxID=36881 RepID=A0AAE0BXU9_9CHLO|nr:hypothetical protein CYMTET_46240 [Cymbomonas tetramitiformis]